MQEIAQLIGKLSDTSFVVLLAPLHYRSQQRLQILEFLIQKNLERKVGLSQEAKKKLIQWVNNFKLNNERSLVSSKPQIIIASDASMKVWGACWGPKLRDHCHDHSGEHVSMLPRITVAH